jgi:hypothetical protein
MDRVALPVRTPALTFCAAALALLLGGTAAAVTDQERIQAYQEFRGAFDTRRYAEAAALADKLVGLTESQHGPESKALVNPLTNLGTAHYRAANYAAAETAYQRALAIAEAQATSGADPLQIRPLHGLGEVLLATRRFDAAAISLERAVALTRNLRGLYDESQLAILPSLIESYVSLQDFAQAEKEHQYAFRVAETAYGRNDQRLLAPLDRFAQWYEFLGRYSTARVLHARGLQIAEQAAGQNSLLAVRPLRGLSRSYLLEYIYGPEETGEQPQTQDAAGNNISTSRLNPDGEKALQLAISTLNKQQPDNHADLGDTLVDLGDWYLLGGTSRKANDAFRLAFQEYEKAGLGERLAVPKQLTYRATLMSTLRFRPDNPDDYETRSIETRLLVGADGKIGDVTVVAADVPEATVKSVQLALKRARYRPRVDGTGTLETRDFPYTEKIYVRKPGTTSAAKGT